MAKRIALKDFVEIDNTEISELCRAVSFSSEHEQVDLSGFNADGTDENLAGKTVQSVTLEVFGSYGTNEIHDVFYQRHRNRTTFAFKWRPDQTLPVSTTNPQLEGNVPALPYSPGVTRGEVETFEVLLTAADSAGLVFTNT